MAPSLHGLKHMLYEEDAVEYHIRVRLGCYNVKNASIQLFGQNIEVVDDVTHLGNYISNDR